MRQQLLRQRTKESCRKSRVSSLRRLELRHRAAVSTTTAAAAAAASAASPTLLRHQICTRLPDDLRRSVLLPFGARTAAAFDSGVELRRAASCAEECVAFDALRQWQRRERRQLRRTVDEDGLRRSRRRGRRQRGRRRAAQQRRQRRRLRCIRLALLLQSRAHLRRVRLQHTPTAAAAAAAATGTCGLVVRACVLSNGGRVDGGCLVPLSQPLPPLLQQVPLPRLVPRALIRTRPTRRRAVAAPSAPTPAAHAAAAAAAADAGSTPLAVPPCGPRAAAPEAVAADRGRRRAADTQGKGIGVLKRPLELHTLPCRRRRRTAVTVKTVPSLTLALSVPVPIVRVGVGVGDTRSGGGGSSSLCRSRLPGPTT
eukprot:Rhum_TRINITY_DN14357_c2_g1::Rhum_TRINITY_DN14357_c2_g1_i1::g.84072::m.84072